VAEAAALITIMQAAMEQEAHLAHMSQRAADMDAIDITIITVVLVVLDQAET
jgi:hypothetical protein